MVRAGSGFCNPGLRLPGSTETRFPMPDVSPPDFPPPNLAQAILETIARVTGRKVMSSQVYAFEGDSIEVACVLRDDGSLGVGFADPLSSDRSAAFFANKVV
jgi:hypothetical protein